MKKQQDERFVFIKPRVLNKLVVLMNTIIKMIHCVEFRELSRNSNALNSYLIKVLTDNRPRYVIDQLLCPIELMVGFSFISMSFNDNESLLALLYCYR